MRYYEQHRADGHRERDESFARYELCWRHAIVEYAAFAAEHLAIAEVVSEQHGGQRAVSDRRKQPVEE